MYECMLILCVYICVCAHIPVDELISPKDIDPIHRYVPRQDQRNVSMRYSNQVSADVTVVGCRHLALIQTVHTYFKTYYPEYSYALWTFSLNTTLDSNAPC